MGHVMTLSTVLTVLAATLPVFTQQARNTETVQGQKFEFFCEVEATPKPEITWLVVRRRSSYHDYMYMYMLFLA